MKAELIEWLVNVKSFNKTRITASFEKKAPVKKSTTKTSKTKKAVSKNGTFQAVATITISKKPLPPKRIAGKVVKAPEPEIEEEPEEEPEESE
jgi:hypothetical protein